MKSISIIAIVFIMYILDAAEATTTATRVIINF